MAAYWETAAHSAYDMFSKFKYLIVNLVFRFLEYFTVKYTVYIEILPNKFSLNTMYMLLGALSFS